MFRWRNRVDTRTHERSKQRSAQKMRPLLQMCTGQNVPQQPHLSPEGLCHLPQHRLVPLLLQAAQGSQLCKVKYDHEVTRVDEDGDAALVRLSGPDGANELRCKYVVACTLPTSFCVTCRPAPV